MLFSLALERSVGSEASEGWTEREAGLPVMVGEAEAVMRADSTAGSCHCVCVCVCVCVFEVKGS